MARRRVRSATGWRQLPLPGFEALLAASDEAAGRGQAPAAAGGGAEEGWEGACYREGCRHAGALAAARLAALEGALHDARPAGYAVTGWRERWLVTRFGDVRVRRRLYRAPDGTAHFLLDEHLGWARAQAVSPELVPLLVEWAAAVPFRTAARWLGQATAGAVGGSTAWRAVQRVAARVAAAERAAQRVWAATGALPRPEGRRAVPVLFVEADGVWVKTQREPAHRHGCELKCASAYEGWREVGRPTPGHPRPHHRLVEKRVYCHAHDHRDASGHADRGGPAALPFWDGVSLALSRTYDLGAVPLVVVGGDGAQWIDGAAGVFHRTVRQRDGFHLARDAARGWGPAAGAQLYEALRRSDRPAALGLLALPPPSECPAPALPAPPAPPGRAGPQGPSMAAAPAPRPRRGWSADQVGRARAAVLAQVATPDARALGTMEGTNAHLLAKRMKKKGMAWTVRGARRLAKVRELVANGTLAPWCHRPAGPPPFAPGAPRHPAGYAPPGPLPWPQVACPAALGPLTDPTAALLHRIDTGARARHRLL